MSKQHENLNKFYTKSSKQSKTSTNPTQSSRDTDVIRMQHLTTKNELVDTNTPNLDLINLNKEDIKRSESSTNSMNNLKKLNSKNDVNGINRVANINNNFSSLRIPSKVSNNRNFTGTLSPAMSDATINLKSNDGDDLFDNKSSYSKTGNYLSLFL